MNEQPIYTVDLTETTRLTAYLDTDNYHWQDVTGEGLNVQPIQFFDRYNRNILSSDDKHQQNIARLVDSFHYYNHERNYAELRERAVSLYLNSCGLPHRFVTLKGYSQGERIDVVIYGDTAEDTWILEPNSHDGLNAWFAGDIFTVCFEKLETWTSSNGDTRQEWEVVDGFGCCLLEEGEKSLSEYKHDFMAVA